MPAPNSANPWIESGREAGLLLSAQNGDVTSFCELFQVHERPLYRLCFALSRSPEAAAGLMRDCARLAWRGLKQLPVGRAFFPFLARIARNLAVAHQRRNAGASHEPPLRRPSGIPWGGGTGNPAIVAEEQRLLLAFETLTVDEQFLLALRLLEGLSYPQIAEVLDLPLGSVMHRLQGLRGRFENGARAEAA